MYLEQKENMIVRSLSTLPQAVLVILTMSIFMTLYEFIKQFFEMDITLCQSPAINVIFSSFIAGTVAHLISKNQTHMYDQLESTYIDLEQTTLDLEREIARRMENENQMRDNLIYKTILLKDVHHRVKNNLQIISSLLTIQSDMIEDKTIQEALRDSTNRIHSLALLHKKLYQSTDMQNLDYADYIKDLAAILVDNYCISRNIPTLDVEVNVRLLDENTIVSCSLVLSELISNSIKHAFPNGRRGKITICLNQNTNGDYLLVFSDDGVGLPEGFNPKTTETLGMRLINDLITKRLNGTIEVDAKNGARFKICWNEDFIDRATTNHERHELSHPTSVKKWRYHYV
ncbi:MAG: sensor histidine kinase [Nitrospirae bacterium]|nr:sensor histidine kinase [Nitrospirota bacterium]